MRVAHPRPKDWRLDVVAAIDECRQTNLARFADAVLIDKGYPDKQADRVLEDALLEDLIECGVSARTGWLTDKGRTLLRDRAG